MSAVSRSVRNSAVAPPRSSTQRTIARRVVARVWSVANRTATIRLQPRIATRRAARPRRRRAARSRSRSSRPGSGSRVRSRSASRARPPRPAAARPPAAGGWCTSRCSRIPRGARAGGPSPAGRGRPPGAARRGRARRPTARPVVTAADSAVARRRCGVPPGRPPVEPELAGEGGDRPAVAVEHVQFHPGVLRLQAVPPVVGSELSSPSLTGGTSRVPTQTKEPPGHPEGLCTFRAHLSAVFMPAHNARVALSQGAYTLTGNELDPWAGPTTRRTRPEGQRAEQHVRREAPRHARALEQSHWISSPGGSSISIVARPLTPGRRSLAESASPGAPPPPPATCWLGQGRWDLIGGRVQDWSACTRPPGMNAHCRGEQEVRPRHQPRPHSVGGQPAMLTVSSGGRPGERS